MKGEKTKSAVGMGRHLSMLAAWGLSICRKLAKAMGGEMKVSSVLGKGTTFAIVVPGVEVAGEELRIENGKCKMKEENSAILHSTFSTLHSSSHRLLIADDTKMNQIVLKTMFTKLGVSDNIAVFWYNTDRKTKGRDETAKERYQVGGARIRLLRRQLPSAHDLEGRQVVQT